MFDPGRYGRLWSEYSKKASALVFSGSHGEPEPRRRRLRRAATARVTINKNPSSGRFEAPACAFSSGAHGEQRKIEGVEALGELGVFAVFAQCQQ